MSGAYYNEFDPKAAPWLRELIRRELIAPGDVDDRSIEDIKPYELAKYTQCHFFAGIGVWSYALRAAGWDDTRRVWTGSCPCQPLSQAGKGLGFADERHLWPAWEHLVRECRPPVLFGEQVASKAADSWADLVQDDLEALGYAFGAVPFPAASVGAPHIRDRLYWMAVNESEQSHGRRDARRGRRESADHGTNGDGMAHHQSARRREERPHGGRLLVGDRAQGLSTGLESGGCDSGLADDDDDAGRQQHAQRDSEPERGQQEGPSGDNPGRCSQLGDSNGEREVSLGGVRQGSQPELDRTVAHDGELGHYHSAGSQGRSLPAGGRTDQRTPWTPSDFVWCRDGKWRPVEPGSFPLAHGAPARVGRLRGYGNAIVSEAAKVFIESSGLL